MPKTQKKKTTRLTTARREALIRDILNAEHDLMGLGQTHQLTPDQLAHWIEQPGNRQCLLGLCLLADVQTQLLLSRYRLLAANRLIRLATHEDESIKDDTARRACVDLLRLDLKRVDGSFDPDESIDDESSLPDLRQWLYGDADQAGDASEPSS